MLYNEGAKHWHGLSREVVDAPSIETFQAGCGSEQPETDEDAPAHCRGLELDDL